MGKRNLMNILRITVIVFLATVAGVRCVSAQNIRGFVNGGVMGDMNNQHFPAVAGGALVDLGQPWVSAGAQGEVFMSWPYFGGRGAAFGQGNLVTRGPVRPFLLGGFGWGESAGPMFGAGVDLASPEHRVGFRVSVEDYLARVSGFDCAVFGGCQTAPHGGRPFTGHQVTVRVGILFR
jgi:hypothetical protein